MASGEQVTIVSIADLASADMSKGPYRVEGKVDDVSFVPSVAQGSYHITGNLYDPSAPTVFITFRYSVNGLVRPEIWVTRKAREWRLASSVQLEGRLFEADEIRYLNVHSLQVR